MSLIFGLDFVFLMETSPGVIFGSFTFKYVYVFVYTDVPCTFLGYSRKFIWFAVQEQKGQKNP